jgi:3-hydroxybutyrate dehydrogenase
LKLPKMLQGGTAIITGSTSGIGLGTARALAEAGCDIMLNGVGEAAAIERERARIVALTVFLCAAAAAQIRGAALPVDGGWTAQ